MKIKNLPGEFAFKALFKQGAQWKLSLNFFTSLEEAKSYAGTDEFKWPVEVYDDSSIYCPTKEELE